MTYAIEDRGFITRYYNVEKRRRVEESRGEEWARYRHLWDAPVSELAQTTPPPSAGA